MRYVIGTCGVLWFGCYFSVSYVVLPTPVFYTQFLYVASASKLQDDAQRAAIFAASFVIVWVGAGVITVNAYLLGGTLYGKANFY